MGMFTTVILDDGTEVQFKCGSDECETFRIGDEVPWHVDPEYGGEGYLLDGVYQGFSLSPSGEGVYYWVVITGHRIVAVEEIPKDEDDDTEDRPGPWKRYGLMPPDRSLWSEEAWKRREEVEAEAKRRSQQSYDTYRGLVRSLYPQMDGREADFIASAASALSQRMDYAKIGREIFKVETLPADSTLHGLPRDMEGDRDAPDAD